MLYRILPNLINLNRQKKQFIQVIFDIISVSFSFIFTFYLLNKHFIFIDTPKIWLILIFIILINIIIFYIFGLYKAVVRHISVETIKHIGVSIIISSIFMMCTYKIFKIKDPFSIVFIFSVLLFLITLGARLILRELYYNHSKVKRKAVAIYGAGDAGRQILNSISKSSEYSPKMFIDDNVNLIGRRITNLDIYSMTQAEKLFVKYKIDLLLVAMPSVSKTVRNNILNQLKKYPFQIKAMPSLTDIINGTVKINDMKTLSINDLIGRDIVEPDRKLMSKNILNKVVLVSGAGGSIGSELCRQILICNPKKLILLDISEAALFNIQQELEMISQQNILTDVIPIICSIQNELHILKILEKFNIQTIYHAAAYKHVPLVENNIVEAIRNNIFGTKILAEMAIKAKVENFILISSDKAVRPTNFMGATKRFAEILCQDLALKKITNFSMVRFGNVLGSSGSVIPQFKNQIKQGGPITLTHKDITRFFMTIPEAAQLVLQASSMSKSGDIFVLEMGEPIKIIDLAFKMIHLQGLKPYIKESDSNVTGDIEIIITGLRPGEKLFEEVLLGDTAINTSHPKIFMEKLSKIQTKDLNDLTKRLEEACDLGDITKIKDIFSHPEISLNHSGIIVDKTLIN